jgi:P450-derived glycosyltransferase activator
MSDIRTAARFAAGLYLQQAFLLAHGYLRREPLARLSLRPGRADPYGIYERMRAAGPIQPTLLGNWVTVSHAVCGSVLRDRRFGVSPEGGTREEELFDMSFLGMNPPDHTRLRRLAQPAFSPKAVAGYAPRIEATVAGLLDQAAATGQFDLVPAFAAALPIAVITDLMGIPDADAAEFTRYGVTIGSALDGIRSLRHAARLRQAETALNAMFEALFGLRRRDPGDDVVSRVVAAEGGQVQPAEMLPLCELLLVAGFETTVNLIGNTVLALLAHPGQWREVCADPAGLAGPAVEETLRYDPPVHMTSRVAHQDAEVAGQEVRKGQVVLTLIGATGRDPEVHERPGEFDIHRETAVENLAFSSGIHYCLGKPLALLEATIAVRALAERLPGLALAGPVRRRNNTVIRGPVSVPVTAGTRPAPAPVPAAG